MKISFGMVVLIVMLAAFFNALLVGVMVSNKPRLSFWRYFGIAMVFSPFAAMLLALVDIAEDNRKGRQ